MPTLLYKDFTLVKGTGFNSWRRVGSAMQAIKVYEMRKVDELVFLDITATQQQRDPDFDLIDDLADECFMPLTVGGGIQYIEQVRKLLMAGADKVSVNSANVTRPKLIEEIATQFGGQCCIASIDFRRHDDQRAEVFIRSGQMATGLDPVELARQVEDLGAGEIILTSIERDGTMTGYDIDMIAAVSQAVSIPVIASGGCSGFQDMDNALREGGASAVASAAIYHFTEQTPLEAKHYLAEAGHPIRL